MGSRLGRSRGERSVRAQWGAQRHAARPGERLDTHRVGEALGEWKDSEVRIAQVYRECTGFGFERIEDLYQDVVEGLLGGSFESEEHLRNTLRRAIKNRALSWRRDERNRARILALNAPALHRAAQAREDLGGPERSVLLEEDRQIVAEFFAELTVREREVFPGVAEGMRYRAIATRLEMPVNEARNACRSSELKAARFQLLYTSGRLCGYRARTIQALKARQADSEELAGQAVAHLRHCARCRAEHRTNARQLARSFREQALALMPLPFLVTHRWLGALTLRARAVRAHALGGHVVVRARLAAGRFAPSVGNSVGGVRLSLRVAAVAAVAAGTVSATHTLAQPHTPAAHRPVVAHRSSVQIAVERAEGPYSSSQAQVAVRPAHAKGRRTEPRAPGQVVALPRPAAVPLREVAPAPVSVPLAAAARKRAEPAQIGGGPFSP
jgi:RNA polymerase sigma factor (sigma-70 family)